MTFVPNLAQTLMKDQTFVEDMSRYAEGICTEQAIRKKYRLDLDDDAWEVLGQNDELVRAIEEERTRRIRSGAAKREKAQNFVTSAPDILNGIMSNPKESARHRIDSAKVLNDFADPGPSRFEQDEDRVHIVINLGNDEKIVIGGPVKPTPATNIIDATPAPQELPPPRRRGRPPGSKNRPKVVDAEQLLPFESDEEGNDAV
jgi:hypothetical protein